MNLVTLAGVRGGGGTTTVVGALGDALHALGQRVLLVDLNTADLLRLHFDVPHADEHGWVAATLPAEWRRQAFELEPGFVLAPFGRKAIEESRASYLVRGDDFWLEALPGLEEDFDWVLLDCPSYPRLAPALRFRSTLHMLVARPDIAAHVLLAQSDLDEASRLLINGFEPSSQLECDVVLDWRHRYGERVLPQSICYDENLHEALACKRPITRHMPGAAASQAAWSIAQWCLSTYAQTA
jgi:cellulose synthase operon protein YhjQ